jgi:hypothetical protein
VRLAARAHAFLEQREAVLCGVSWQGQSPSSERRGYKRDWTRRDVRRAMRRRRRPLRPSACCPGRCRASSRGSSAADAVQRGRTRRRRGRVACFEC